MVWMEIGDEETSIMVVLSKTQMEFFEFTESGGDLAKKFGNTSI